MLFVSHQIQLQLCGHLGNYLTSKYSFQSYIVLIPETCKLCLSVCVTLYIYFLKIKATFSKTH